MAFIHLFIIHLLLEHSFAPALKFIFKISSTINVHLFRPSKGPDNYARIKAYANQPKSPSTAPYPLVATPCFIINIYKYVFEQLTVNINLLRHSGVTPRPGQPQPHPLAASTSITAGLVRWARRLSSLRLWRNASGLLRHVWQQQTQSWNLNTKLMTPFIIPAQFPCNHKMDWFILYFIWHNYSAPSGNARMKRHGMSFFANWSITGSIHQKQSAWRTRMWPITHRRRIGMHNSCALTWRRWTSHFAGKCGIYRQNFKAPKWTFIYYSNPDVQPETPQADVVTPVEVAAVAGHQLVDYLCD